MKRARSRVFIIAEAGVNHNASFELAKRMIDAAKYAGADCVKFQTAIPELVISRYAEKAEYQKSTTGEEESQLDMCKKIHLPVSDYLPLRDYCEEVGIEFASTPFDSVSIDVLKELGMGFWKVPSGEITNLPYLRKIARYGEPVILSTGMATLEEVGDAMDVLLENGVSKDQITLLHCTTEYPAPVEGVNLCAMQTLGDHFGVSVGYSDHTQGITIPVAAVAMGATVIEKHFTLDKSMEGPDHLASLTPDELQAMCVAIREVEAAMGDGVKVPSEAEKKNIDIVRKSIVATCDIAQGERLSEENLTVKRPGGGVSPMLWDSVVGGVAVRDFSEDELIEI